MYQTALFNSLKKFFSFGFEALITRLFREFQCNVPIFLCRPSAVQQVIRDTSSEVGKGVVGLETDCFVIVLDGDEVFA